MRQVNHRKVAFCGCNERSETTSCKVFLSKNHPWRLCSKEQNLRGVLKYPLQSSQSVVIPVAQDHDLLFVTEYVRESYWMIDCSVCGEAKGREPVKIGDP